MMAATTGGWKKRIRFGIGKYLLKFNACIYLVECTEWCFQYIIVILQSH